MNQDLLEKLGVLNVVFLRKWFDRHFHLDSLKFHRSDNFHWDIVWRLEFEVEKFVERMMHRWLSFSLVSSSSSFSSLNQLFTEETGRELASYTHTHT